MLPLSPRRRFLSLSALAGGALALFLTQPRFSTGNNSDQNTAACLSNLNQIARAYSLYAQDFDGHLPRGVDPEDHLYPQIWRDDPIYGGQFYRDILTAPMLHQVLRPYVKSPEVFHCPGDVGWTVSRLGQIKNPATQEPYMNSNLRNLRPSAFSQVGTSYFCWTIYNFQIITAADIENPSQKILLFDGDLWHSNSGRQLINGLFADGHVQNLTAQQFFSYSPQG